MRIDISGTEKDGITVKKTFIFLPEVLSANLAVPVNKTYNYLSPGFEYPVYLSQCPGWIIDKTYSGYHKGIIEAPILPGQVLSNSVDSFYSFLSSFPAHLFRGITAFADTKGGGKNTTANTNFNTLTLNRQHLSYYFKL